MQGNHKYQPQLNMLNVQLKTLISAGNPLVVLSHRINWEKIVEGFEPYYSKEGRPSLPTRTMVGLLILKSMFSESDESLIPIWVENSYWQYFCGEKFVNHASPSDPSDLAKNKR